MQDHEEENAPQQTDDRIVITGAGGYDSRRRAKAIAQTMLGMGFALAADMTGSRGFFDIFNDVAKGPGHPRNPNDFTKDRGLGSKSKTPAAKRLDAHIRAQNLAKLKKKGANA